MPLGWGAESIQFSPLDIAIVYIRKKHLQQKELQYVELTLICCLFADASGCNWKSGTMWGYLGIWTIVMQHSKGFGAPDNDYA